MRERRPLIAVPARFSATTSALRYSAEVAAAALMEAIFAAGGEPLVVHPGPQDANDDDEIGARLTWADGVVLPGGGDLAAEWSGQQPHPSLCDVDPRQDAFDLGIARVTLAHAVPLLAICRGLQVVNVARGGTVVQDMEETVGHHRHRRHRVAVADDKRLHTAIRGRTVDVSCYHHQCIDRLGDGLVVIAEADDGVIEAVRLDGHDGWFLGVQWHPEDTCASDPTQAALFDELADAARRYAAERLA